MKGHSQNFLLFLSSLFLIHTFLFSSVNAASPAWFSYVQNVGRVRYTENLIRFDWPGSGLHFQFVAKQKSVELNITLHEKGTEIRYGALELNCDTRIGKFGISSTQPLVRQEIPTSIGKTYDIVFRKLNEAYTGNFEVVDLKIKGGNFINATSFRPICVKKAKWIAYGDSFTVGLGTERLNPCKNKSAADDDVTHAYASYVARNLSLDLHTIAWAGLGYARGYGVKNPGQHDSMLLTYMNRTIGHHPLGKNNENYWKPSRFQADLVTINLGVNDYWHKATNNTNDIADEVVKKGAINFINQVKKDYPKAKILVINPSAKRDYLHETLSAASEATKVNYYAISSNVYAGGYGCAYHPYRITQENIAKELSPVIQRILAASLNDLPYKPTKVTATTSLRATTTTTTTSNSTTEGNTAATPSTGEEKKVNQEASKEEGTESNGSYQRISSSNYFVSVVLVLSSLLIWL